jgi:hypothetical protein
MVTMQCNAMSFDDVRASLPSTQSDIQQPSSSSAHQVPGDLVPVLVQTPKVSAIQPARAGPTSSSPNEGSGTLILIRVQAPKVLAQTISGQGVLHRPTLLRIKLSPKPRTPILIPIPLRLQHPTDRVEELVAIRTRQTLRQRQGHTQRIEVGVEVGHRVRGVLDNAGRRSGAG